MLSVSFHALEFLAYHLIISVVDRVSRLPRNSTPPEMMRLLRENVALKSQVRALVLELKAVNGKKPRVSRRTRAAQVLAYLLTRGDKSFTRYILPLGLNADVEELGDTISEGALAPEKESWRQASAGQGSC